MKIVRFTALLPLALFFTACGGDEPDADTTVVGDTAMMAPATPPAGSVTPADQGAGTQTVQLNPLGGSGVSGEATLTRTNGQTQVMVRLTGTPGNTTHPGHIHAGTCDAPGSPVQPLESVSTDATGSGTATTSVTVDQATVFNGQHVIQYHQAGGGPGVVCGQITQS